MIMCDTRASGITADLADSYLVRVELRPNGGAHVLWTDEPDQAMVFDDAAAAAEFCRDSPLEMFVVSFVPAPGLPGSRAERTASTGGAGEPRRRDARHGPDVGGCTTGLLGMIFVRLVTSGSESRCLSDSCPEPGGWGGVGCDEVVPAAAGVLAAQGEDVGGAFDGPVHAGLLGALDDDGLDAAFDGT